MCRLVLPLQLVLFLSTIPAVSAGEPLGVAWENLSPLLTEIVRDNLPHEFEDLRDWGGQKAIFDGLDVHRDGLQIRTKRKWKLVNHGSWTRHKATLLNPEQKFVIRLENARPAEPPRDGRLAFDVIGEAKLALFGRLSQWQTGVQLISLSLDAEADVRLKLSCEVSVRLDAGRFPPDVVVVPEVKDADLQLLAFRLHRISNLHGPLVDQLGRGMRRVLDEKFDDARPKLVSRINTQLGRRQDQLRFSASEALDKLQGLISGSKLTDR